MKERFAVTVSSGGDAAALNCALRSTEQGGICTDTGIFFEPTTAVPLLAMYDTGITFRTGRAHIRADIESVLALVATGRFDPRQLVQATSSWDDADAAVSDLTNKLLITRS